MKNILVIKTSPRKDGNSDILTDAFIKGATNAGNNVEEVSLIHKKPLIVFLY
ncbi:MAG: NAD(P)H-dependent oxidoreductase [Paludibacteraceae bacterium]|nr:NAD(P)H-dependent oxidoreductase [Paludibacteraceae bacterium]